MTATEQRELTSWMPQTTYNGEDCIIIPIRQITNVEFKIDSMSPYNIPTTEMILTVRAR